MLAKEKDARPRDGHEVARLLEGIEDMSNPGAPPAQTSAPSPSAITEAEQRFIGVIVAESQNFMDPTTIDRTLSAECNRHPVVLVVDDLLVPACRRLEQLHRCIAIVEELEKESADTSFSPAIAEALASTAAELMYGGCLAEADVLLVRFERLRAASDDPLVQMHWHFAMSEKATIAGDLSESIRHDTLALETSLERGDLRDLARRRSNVAHGYTELDAYELAEEELRQAVAAAERLGLAHLGAVIHMNLGWALVRASTGGDLTAPRRLIEGAARDFARMGHARFEAAAVRYLAHVHLRAGDAVGAEAVMNRVLLLDLPTGELPFALATRAMARLAQGRTAEALADARRGEQILDEQASIPEGEVIVRLASAEALFSSGQPDDARIAVRKACDVVRNTAAKITDERLRECYLTRVSEDSRALDLERSWTETR